MKANNSLYNEINESPIRVDVKSDAREVILELVSCMCDNKYTFKFKKDSNGEFRLSCGGYSYSNFQIRSHSKADLEWLADEYEWHDIVRAINGGVQRVYQIKQR